MMEIGAPVDQMIRHPINGKNMRLHIDFAVTAQKREHTAII